MSPDLTEKDYVILPDNEIIEGVNARIMLVRAPWESIIFRYTYVKFNWDEANDQISVKFNVEIIEPLSVKANIDKNGIPDGLQEYMGDLIMFFYAKNLEGENENRTDGTVQPTT